MTNDEDRAKPLSIDEIEAQSKGKPTRRNIGFPVGVGHTGFSLGKGNVERQYSRDDDDESVPNGATVGAKVK